MRRIEEKEVMIIEAFVLIFIVFTSLQIQNYESKITDYEKDTTDIFIKAMNYHNLKMDYKFNKGQLTITKFFVTQGMEYDPYAYSDNGLITEPKIIELMKKYNSGDNDTQLLDGLTAYYSERSKYMLERYNEEITRYLSRINSTDLKNLTDKKLCWDNINILSILIASILYLRIAYLINKRDKNSRLRNSAKK